MTLLEKCRAINRILQKSAGYTVDFGEMAQVLCANLGANVYILDDQGRILGAEFLDDFSCEVVRSIIYQSGFPREYNAWLLGIPTTYSNFCQTKNACIFKAYEHCQFVDKVTTVVPIVGAGKRLGTLVLAKFGEEFTNDDLILAEIGAAVVGMEILRAQVGKMEEEARKRAAVQVALGTLSYSELDAVRHIFEQLDGEEGLLVASKIADRVGITRSVIVNALRKFESAGVIESKSLGMKGTYIRVLNNRLLDELARMKHS
jgi:transcriptional pleiotropic repressor